LLATPDFKATVYVGPTPSPPVIPDEPDGAVVAVVPDVALVAVAVPMACELVPAEEELLPVVALLQSNADHGTGTREPLLWWRIT